MTRLLLSLSLFLLPCTARAGMPEPVNGCLMAAANARAYLDPRIPARILRLRSADGRADHAALVYRLPEGFVCYDDTFRTQVLHRLRWSDPRTFPPALTVARLAFGPAITTAWWMPPAPAR